MQTQYETLRKITETNLTGKQQRGVACCDLWATADHRKSSVFAAAAIQSPGTTERTCLQCARVLMRSVRWQSGAVRLLRDGHTHTHNQQKTVVTPTHKLCRLFSIHYSSSRWIASTSRNVLFDALSGTHFLRLFSEATRCLFSNLD